MFARLCGIDIVCPVSPVVAEVEKEGDATRRDGDPKTEINKLFSKLKSSSSSSSSSRLEPSKSTRPRGWREVGRRPKSPSAASVGHATRDAVVEVLKELNAWPVLLKFCGELPVLGVLGKDKAFLSGCVGEGAHSLETLIERYIQYMLPACLYTVEPLNSIHQKKGLVTLPHFRGAFVEKVSCLERCPQFVGVLIEGFHTGSAVSGCVVLVSVCVGTGPY